jgi:hypothetical protein
MPEGHEARFEERLAGAFPPRRRPTWGWLAIAASVVALLGFGVWVFRPAPVIPVPSEQVVSQDSVKTRPGLSLGDLSPDLRKVEQYYTANISLELASLDISPENKKMADDYMARLRELDTEYQSLVAELNEDGPNEETISAMIRNFQIRLQLLQKLKAKLNEIKQSKNETVSSNSV